MFAAMVAVVLELLVVVVAAVNLVATVCGWQRVRVVTARSIVLLTAAAASWCVLHGWYRSAAVSAASCAAWCLYWGGPGRKRRGRSSQACPPDRLRCSGSPRKPPTRGSLYPRR